MVGAGVVVGSGGDACAPGGFPPPPPPANVEGFRELSQQTDPDLQFEVRDIKTDGRSHNGAIMLSRQNPGQRFKGGGCG